MAQRLVIEVATRQGDFILHLSGRLDGSGARAVAWCLEALEGHRTVLDFSHLEAVEPIGARVLAIRLKRLRAAGVRAELEGLTEPVARELWLGGVLEAPAGV